MSFADVGIRIRDLRKERGLNQDEIERPPPKRQAVGSNPAGIITENRWNTTFRRFSLFAVICSCRAKYATIICRMICKRKARFGGFTA